MRQISQIHEVRTIKELRTMSKYKGASYVFFWGHSDTDPERVNEGCLSNWYPAPFELDGIVYPTSEHWMMTEKARLFEDDDSLALMLEAESPWKVKKLGRKVANFDNDVWRKYCFDSTVKGCIAKFTQNPHLGEYLKNTGKSVLVEASPYDTVWGIGMAFDKDNLEIGDPTNWKGENLLGFVLMEVRDQLNFISSAASSI